MKKVLIYLDKNKLSPRGGPYGYNYNLNIGLNQLDLHDIEIDYVDCNDTESRIKSAIKSNKNGAMKNIAFVFNNLFQKAKLLYGKNHYSAVDLNQYDLVHFHSSRLMFDVRDSLDSYHGIVAFTSHSPTLLSKEIFDSLTEFEKKHLAWFYRKLEKMDEYCFNRADFLIFPCEQAEEPYFHNWSKYKEIKSKKKECYRYLPTGTLPKSAKQDKKKIRDSYSIPQDAFVVCYVGRHNEIKGYADLRLFGEKALKKYNNVYFLIAGKEEPLKGLSDERWIEVGWTDDPGSIISAADIFILPNRETYFDLVLLEVLSLGQIVLASKTGGNKFFEQFSDSGIFLYENEDDLLGKFDSLVMLSKSILDKYRVANFEIYKNNFSNEVFAKRYVEIVRELLQI